MMARLTSCMYAADTEQTGLYPTFTQNATTKEWVAVNGGLPQVANMSAHLSQWSEEIEAMIPDPQSTAVVGLDWEDWQPYWDGNNRRAMAEPDQDIFQNESMKLVKAQHPTWNDAQVLAEAKKQFNLGAEMFWTETFKLAQKMRPNALWSNYDTGHCGNYACNDAEYYPWQAQAERLGYRPKTYPPIALPASQPPALCPAPNDNDSDELLWMWKLLDVIEPVIYLSTQNASFNRAYVDCKLGEARRVATLARPLRGGKRMPIYAYGWYDWNAMFGDSATSQYLNQSALDTIFLRAAMKHGIDGVFMWGGGFRDCASAFECKGSGTCAGGHCTANTSIGTYVNTLLGPAVQTAVTTAAACSVGRCGGRGRCFDCPEPFDATGFAECRCDCDDGHSGAACASNAPLEAAL